MTMLVQSADTLWCDTEEHLYDEMDNISLDDLLYSSLHSDDMWKKFEFLDVPTSEFTPCTINPVPEPDTHLDSLLEWSLDASTCGTQKEISEIRHHDCMWAGHCGSKEHKPEVAKTLPTIVPKPPCPTSATPLVKKPTTVVVQSSNPGRSLLLTSRNQINAPTVKAAVAASSGVTVQTVLPPAAVGHVGPRPDSPPSSDDDDHPRFKHEIAAIFDTPVNKTLQFLNDAISECDFDEDSDLCDYFEDSDVFAGTESEQTPPRSYPGESDHSYHKGKGAQLRMDHLGVQTPSDSEEEIDVVSIGEKQSSNPSRCNTVLPTNPSIRDRQKLQRTVASAITGKREYGHQTAGIKTRLPLRIPNVNTPPNESSTSHKKRTANSDGRSAGRGIKRARHHRYQKSPGSSPNKRRHGYNQSSDSETECSEKRSLHNNMERQRRVDLRNAFDDLRVLVPEVCSKERAAKVVILREAASYCDKLSNDSASMAKQVSEMRKQQERLRARVSQLRRSLAAKR